MIPVRMIGIEARCGRPGCTDSSILAFLHHDEDGGQTARINGRWKLSGHLDGMERYVRVKTRGRRVRTLADGRIEHIRDWGRRAPCPVVLVCPTCGSTEVMGLTPPPPSP